MNNAVAFEIPEDQDPSRCKGCKALIYWVKTARGNPMPVDPDGTSHIATCPKAGKFTHYDPKRDPKRTRQSRLLSDLMGRHHAMRMWEKNFIGSMSSKFENGKQLTNAEDAALEKLHEENL